jgi:2-hydroxychromene-2-carboxylate isomerase
VSVVLYGSFNCPYSFLASLRVDRLIAVGGVAVEWRAVVHDPAVAAEGEQTSDEVAALLDRELEEIRGLLAPGEPYPARRPAVQVNTTAAAAGYSALDGPNSDRLRAALFETFWVDGLNIGDRSVLDRLSCPAASPGQTTRRWQRAWEGTDPRMVPMMVLPDGRVLRGTDVLSGLAEMTTAGAGGTHGN